MKIQFLGAAETVTGSMHLVIANGHRILLDCGLFQGKRDEARRRNENLPIDPSTLDAVVLSHAHIDHSGNLPVLARQGYRGPILATSATHDLCTIMLRDSASIQESDALFVSQLNAEKGLPPVKPLYTLDDANRALGLFKDVDYDRPQEILPGVTLTLRDAGHILGSATVTLTVQEGQPARTRQLVFTGDIGREGMAILRDPEKLERADVLITEGTYGGREHGPMQDAQEKLRQVIVSTFKRGGVLIIPAFAIGRAQEIVYDLHLLIEGGLIPAEPIYVDSPLAANATDVFRNHPECFDAETVEHMKRDKTTDPFGLWRVTYTRSVEESKKLNDSDKPAIIISASGMCEAGRVLHHLRHHIGDPRATVLFVGYQAQNTLGRKLLDGEKRVRIFGEEHHVAAHIEQIDAYSAHADEGELLDFIGGMQARPERVFVVHAEDEAAQAMAAGLRSLGIPQVTVPARGEEYEV